MCRIRNGRWCRRRRLGQAWRRRFYLWVYHLLCRNKGKLRSSYISCTYVLSRLCRYLTVAAGWRRRRTERKRRIWWTPGLPYCPEMIHLWRYIYIPIRYIGASSDEWWKLLSKVRALIISHPWFTRDCIQVWLSKNIFRWKYHRLPPITTDHQSLTPPRGWKIRPLDQ